MKKLLIVFLLIGLLFLSGCSKDNKAALEFKNEYESLNGVVNKNGKEHRTITIDKDNPYVKVTPEKVVEMINNKETFFLYVGDSLCPWCRSVLEKSIEVAKKYKVEKIYYIEIWNDEGNEIFRDKYELTPLVTKTKEGTKEYYTLLEKFDSVLSEYFLYDPEGHNITTGEKRIYAPNYFFVRNGEVVKMIEGISEKQSDSREELTEEILKDEEEQFKSLFELNNTCDNQGC